MDVALLGDRRRAGVLVLHARRRTASKATAARACRSRCCATTRSCARSTRRARRGRSSCTRSIRTASRTAGASTRTTSTSTATSAISRSRRRATPRTPRSTRCWCPPTWPPPPENEAQIAAYIAARGERALAGGRERRPVRISRRPVLRRRAAGVEQPHAARGAARGTRATRKRLGWIDFHTGLGPRGHGEKIFAGRDDAARSRARARWWGDDVTSFHDGSSTSAPLTGVNVQRRVRRVPGVEYAGIALEYGTLPLPTMLQALRADHWLHKHPEAPRRRCAPRSSSRCATRSTATPTTGRRRSTRRRATAALAGARAARATPDDAMNDARRAARRAPPALGERASPPRGTSDVALELSPFAGGDRSRRSSSRSAWSRALFAPWIAPHNPFDLRTLNLLRRAGAAARGSPAAKPGYLLGTDDQGRDVLSAIMFGARISLLVGLASVALAVVARRVARPRRRLRRRQDRRVHHARRRRAAVVPGDPDRAADRRRRARRAAARRARRAWRCSC